MTNKPTKTHLGLLLLLCFFTASCSDDANPLDAKIKAFLTAQERSADVGCNAHGTLDGSWDFTFLADGTLTAKYSTVHDDGNDNFTTYISERPGTYTIENGVVTINLDNRTNCTANGTPYTCAIGTENYSGTATTEHSNEIIISLDGDNPCGPSQTPTLQFF